MKLYVDPGLAALAPGSVPAGWATRAAFRHPLAAKHWKRALAGVEALEPRDQVVSMYSLLAHKLDGCSQYFISMGPGGGFVDAAIIRNLDTTILQYVPIDLSQEMCRSTSWHLQAICPTPFGVVGDFEGGFAYVRKQLEPLQNHNRMICCTSTIGNLDLGEKNFLQNVLQIMEMGDCLLLSMGTGVFGHPVDRSMLDARIEWRSLSGLLSCSISMITGENVCDIEPNIDQRVDVRKGESDIPGTETVELWDLKCGSTLLSLRRYDLKTTQLWLERSFPLKTIETGKVRFPASDVGIGAIMLTRC